MRWSPIFVLRGRSRHHCVRCYARRIAKRSFVLEYPHAQKKLGHSTDHRDTVAGLRRGAVVACVFLVAVVDAYHLGKDRAGLINFDAHARLHSSRQR